MSTVITTQTGAADTKPPAKAVNARETEPNTGKQLPEIGRDWSAEQIRVYNDPDLEAQRHERASAWKTRQNRLNARASTGPKSVDAKAVTRRNSLKHGLASRGVVALEAERQIIDERLPKWCKQLQPANDVEMYFVKHAVRMTARLDRALQAEDYALLSESYRATVAWEHDRELEITNIAARLHADPARTVNILKGSARGRRWLLKAWDEMWLRVITQEAEVSWICDQARALLGIDPAHRGYSDAFASACIDNAVVSAKQVCILAQETMKTLEDGLIELDEEEYLARDLAMNGIFKDEPAMVRRLSRYVRQSESSLRTALNRLHALQSGRVAVGEVRLPLPEPTEPAELGTMVAESQAAQQGEIATIAPTHPVNAVIDGPRAESSQPRDLEHVTVENLVDSFRLNDVRKVGNVERNQAMNAEYEAALAEPPARIDSYPKLVAAMVKSFAEKPLF